MKTQTFGVSNKLIPTSAAPNGAWKSRRKKLSEGCTHKVFSSWGWSDDYSGYPDYKKNRSNGEDTDSPAEPFPFDGIYTWDTPNEKESRVRYIAGEGDEKWMDERSLKYIIFLEREGNLDKIEPNLRKEVPKLYALTIVAKQEMQKQEKNAIDDVLKLIASNGIVTLNMSEILNKIPLQEDLPSPRKFLSSDELKQLFQALCINKSVKTLQIIDVNINGTEAALADLALARPDINFVPKIEDNAAVYTIVLNKKLLRELESGKKSQEKSEKEKPSVNITNNSGTTTEQPPLSQQPNLPRSLYIPHKDLQFSEQLGEGGFGTVCGGIWQNTDVAIKQLKQVQLKGDVLTNFIKEAEMMSNLRHPNIVHLWGISQDEQDNYSIVMEYMPKGSLFNCLHGNENITWNQKLQIAFDIGTALSFLHSKEILHHDLKSENVLLDDNLRAKISDFGLSVLRPSTKTLSPHQLGSAGTLCDFRWKAPELNEEGARYTEKADVFSYGVILWELATNKKPEGGKPRMKTVPKECPEEFRKLIKFSRKRDPAKRLTIQELTQSLGKLLSSGNGTTTTAKENQTTENPYVPFSSNQPSEEKEHIYVPFSPKS